MSTAEQTGRSPLTASEKEKVLNDTAALIQRALSAGRMLHMTARNSGLHEVEIALGMQLATIYILGGNTAYAGLYKSLLEPLYTIAHLAGASGWKPTMPDPDMPVPDVSLKDDDYEVEKIHVVNSRFEMGPITLSEKVKDSMGPKRLMDCLLRYSERDWGGFLSEEEKAKNNENSEKSDGTIFAIYLVDEKKEREPENTFYIITQPDRSETKVLMASEY